jgi:hypothetical protein
MHFRPFTLFVAVFVPCLVVAGCANGGSGERPRDAGVEPSLDGGRTLDPECGVGFAECPTGFVCAAVGGIPRCVPDPVRPPPGDGTDCNPCPAPGECRMSICVQPSLGGAVCEFDTECAMGELCIAGRCTPDPRLPFPCTDSSMCPAPLVCGPAGVCNCANTVDCPIGLACVEGLCSVGPGGGACVADADCPGDMVCEAGRCRESTLCDIENPDLSGTWMMHSTLRLREALPATVDSFLAAVEEPFRFLSGDSTCIDWDGLPGWVDTAICDLVRPYVDMYLPAWSRPVFRAIADLNDVIGTWEIDETMTLGRGAVRDSYRGEHIWNRVSFMYRDMMVSGDPADIVDWRFSPSNFNGAAVCGQFNIERHALNVSIGSILAWLVDAVIEIASDGRWTGLRAALTDVGGGFCMGLSAAAESSVDYAGVGATVTRVCTGLVSVATNAAITAIRNARLGADPMTLQGYAPIGGPNSLRGGHWDGALLGSGFSGDFDATR